MPAPHPYHQHVAGAQAPEQLGRAMEARAYAGGRARTHLRPLRFVPRRDGAFCALACLYLIALAALAGA